MVDQHGAQALAEAETVAARAWDRPPDSATLLLCWAEKQAEANLSAWLAWATFGMEILQWQSGLLRMAGPGE